MQCGYNQPIFRVVLPDSPRLGAPRCKCYRKVTNNRLPAMTLRAKCSRMLRKPTSGSNRGFSLLELLAVIAVMLVMMSLLLPAVSSFSSTAGRRGAVNVVMNTLEQARVAAIESGQTVYVGFADSTFPVEEMRNAAFIVFRERSEEERDTTISGPQYVVLKTWAKLPRSVAFKEVSASLMSNARDFGQGLSRVLPNGKNHANLAFVAFNPSGAVDEPASNLQIFLTEAVQSGSQQRELGTRTLFEKITLSRYTGRAQLDITTTTAGI